MDTTAELRHKLGPIKNYLELKKTINILERLPNEFHSNVVIYKNNKIAALKSIRDLEFDECRESMNKIEVLLKMQEFKPVRYSWFNNYQLLVLFGLFALDIAIYVHIIITIIK